MDEEEMPEASTPATAATPGGGQRQLARRCRRSFFKPPSWGELPGRLPLRTQIQDFCLFGVNKKGQSSDIYFTFHHGVVNDRGAPAWGVISYIRTSHGVKRISGKRSNALGQRYTLVRGHDGSADKDAAFVSRNVDSWDLRPERCTMNYCYILFLLANHPMTMDRVEKNVKKRKYSEDFLQYGFTSIITAGIEKPQCVICCEVLSAESMKPNKLKRHFDSKHPSFAGKDTNYFRSKADGLKKARLDTDSKYHKQNVVAVEASYLVAFRIARAMKPHTIAEDLLLPVAKDIVRVMIGDEFVTKFDTVGSFLKEHKISWEKVCGVCTDGAPAMLGCRSGFQRLVLNESPKVIGTHCMIHWQILATKTLPQELQEVMKSVIRSVNFVKASSLNSRLFSQLCNELDVPNNAVLFHTEMRWLSRGNILKRVFELRDELKTFFNQKVRPQFEALFSDKSELQKIAYLVDIFAILNELNLSLQGPNATCLDLSEKIRSFQMKLQLWQKKLDENKMYMLPTLSAFFEEHDIEPDKRIMMIIYVKEHLHMLADEISSYFPNLPDTPFALARSPFTVKVENVPETAQKEFIELVNSDAARTDFSTMPVTKFWIKCLQSYPVLSETVLRLLLPFPTTYLCETGFSSLLVIKSKYRSRLVVEDDFRCALAKTAPRISDLVRKKQSQPSH
ncbi:SCAN domain-containing protein 3-like [Protobothrops mucrosquamatus]|uniref:SCAN domain-containing protein 3-like n=1 Tax=Protobothrops mucrosquamatus TaxID=103944 RepID=UPI000775D6BB|nr:SCAN domain-containing protein 3-like [Protobothrops mucrosquamatus]